MSDAKNIDNEYSQTTGATAGSLSFSEPGQKQLFKLEPTAAFVMELAREFYLSNAFTKTFMEQLDLSSAADLINAVKASGDLVFTKEMMCDRKFAMRHALFQQIGLSLDPVQVVILAAGKSPLGLEALHEKNESIAKVFEIDVSSFAEKEKILSAIAPSLLNKLALIQHDILADDLVKVLKSHGYDEQLKTIVLMEGITHYLPALACETILSRFVTSDQNNAVVFEYGPPFESFAPWFQDRARIGYGIIENLIFKRPMVKYSSGWLKTVLHAFGGDLKHVYSMFEIEKMRKGRNELVQGPDSGWFEVGVGVM